MCLFVCLFVFRWSNLAAGLHRSHSTHWFLLRWLQISEVQRHCILPNASKAFIKPGLYQRYKHNLGKAQKNGHKFVSLFSYLIPSVSWFVCLHVLIIASTWLTAGDKCGCSDCCGRKWLREVRPGYWIRIHRLFGLIRFPTEDPSGFAILNVEWNERLGTRGAIRFSMESWAAQHSK